MYIFFYLYLTRQVNIEQILIYNDGLHRPTPEDSGPVVRRPMELPIGTRVSVVTPQALRCSALDRCATREPKVLHYFSPQFKVNTHKPPINCYPVFSLCLKSYTS